ncbi:MAG: hypothetical protein KC609_09515, partial [Myxococcales bacterium]|nr:hypothetical protein [Myxococcales bacterium]
SSVSAYSHDGTTGTVTIVSKRIFEVGFTHSELVPLIGGRRLFLTIQPTGSGKPAYYAMIELQPRFTRFAGSSSIFIYSWIDPVMDGFDLVFRGRVKTPRGVTMRGAFNDDDSEPAQTQEGETRWRYDWIPAALPYSGDPVEDAIRFGGVDADGASLQKSASIEIMLRRVSFTNYRTPFLLWPAPVCADAVLSCLQALESWPSDTEGCGTARQVTPCLAQMPQPPTPPIVTKEHFAGDLRKAIIAYYGEHESDILASGGNTRPQALLSVDTQRIDVVVDPDENALGYDLATHLVYRHPDVVFPGSDIVWFGVYRKSDGGLVELGPFN